MKTKPQTNTQRILNKIDGEIFTTKNWEAHISAHSNDGEKKYTTLDIEREFWYGGRIRLEDVKDWIATNITEEVLNE